MVNYFFLAAGFLAAGLAAGLALAAGFFAGAMENKRLRNRRNYHSSQKLCT